VGARQLELVRAPVMCLSVSGRVRFLSSPGYFTLKLSHFVVAAVRAAALAIVMCRR
jgi:hypothetical protein